MKKQINIRRIKSYIFGLMGIGIIVCGIIHNHTLIFLCDYTLGGLSALIFAYMLELSAEIDDLKKQMEKKAGGRKK